VSRIYNFDDGSSPGIPEPDETPEPDEPVGFVEPKKNDEKMVAALEDAATFYNDLLMSNEDRFKPIWEYLARRGVDKETMANSTSAMPRHTAMNSTTAGH
jgi:DNA primase